MTEERNQDTSASGPRWSVERRLAFIASRLSWERRINRNDIVARFGVSANQASADLRRFSESNPGALAYDSRAKTYRAGAAWRRPDPADAAELLRDLRLVAEGVLPVSEISLAAAPGLALADAPVRAAPPAVLGAIIAAVRGGRALDGVYQSFSHATPRRRRLEPHALVFDGFRWHARARDAEQDVFKDFVLGRLADLLDAGPAAVSPEADTDWRAMVTLSVIPHPGLSPAQRAAVELDYAMSGGVLSLTCRRAVLYYLKRRLGLTDGHADRPAIDQHIVLLSEREGNGAA